MVGNQKAGLEGIQEKMTVKPLQIVIGLAEQNQLTNPLRALDFDGVYETAAQPLRLSNILCSKKGSRLSASALWL